MHMYREILDQAVSKMAAGADEYMLYRRIVTGLCAVPVGGEVPADLRTLCSQINDPDPDIVAWLHKCGVDTVAARTKFLGTLAHVTHVRHNMPRRPGAHLMHGPFMFEGLPGQTTLVRQSIDMAEYMVTDPCERLTQLFIADITAYLALHDVKDDRDVCEQVHDLLRAISPEVQFKLTVWDALARRVDNWAAARKLAGFRDSNVRLWQHVTAVTTEWLQLAVFIGNSGLDKLLACATMRMSPDEVIAMMSPDMADSQLALDVKLDEGVEVKGPAADVQFKDPGMTQEIPQKKLAVTAK